MATEIMMQIIPRSHCSPSRTQRLLVAALQSRCTAGYTVLLLWMPTEIELTRLKILLTADLR